MRNRDIDAESIFEVEINAVIAKGYGKYQRITRAYILSDVVMQHILSHHSLLTYPVLKNSRIVKEIWISKSNRFTSNS